MTEPGEKQSGAPAPTAPSNPSDEAEQPAGTVREEPSPEWGKPVDPKGHPDWQARERHLYSAGGVNRGNVIAFVGLLGASGAAALSALAFPTLESTIAAFSGAAAGCLFALPLVWLYERMFWRWPPIARFKLSKIPDLNGEWEGHIEVKEARGSAELQRELPCRVCIKQDWSRIRIDFITVPTESWSVMATIDSDRLHYEYFVVPRPTAGSDPLAEINPHDGTVRLKPWPRPGRRQSCDCLSGGWYNDPGDFTDEAVSIGSGRIELRRTLR
jgi:hypothetical protein